MESRRINIWWLFLSGTALLSLSLYFRSFSIFVFIGLAPFFAILDYTLQHENFWEHAEMILLGLAISFFAAFTFQMHSIVTVLIHAILFTLPFIGFAFAHEHLGHRTGKFIVILIWLGLEYALVKMQWPKETFFLADSLQNMPVSFAKWTAKTGYLGISAWILVCNWVLYAAALRDKTYWPLMLLGLAIAIGPVVYSYMIQAKAVNREAMIELYKSNTVFSGDYGGKGELLARTCAWVSVLIVVFAGVKSRTK